MQGRIVAVSDAQTVILATGETLQLLGLLAPARNAPLAAEAKVALEHLALGKTVRLYPGEAPLDRYGRIRAQLYLDAPAAGAEPWLQGALLSRGLARVYTLKDNRGCAAALLQREAAARLARRGIWALPDYAVRNAGTLPRSDMGHFVLVEGRIRSVSAHRGTLYLNYGADYRTDFTARIRRSDLTLFRAEGYDLAGLAGQSVRLRGWLEQLNGPLIDITHPEQIERLGAGPAEAGHKEGKP